MGCKAEDIYWQNASHIGHRLQNWCHIWHWWQNVRHNRNRLQNFIHRSRTIGFINTNINMTINWCHTTIENVWLTRLIHAASDCTAMAYIAIDCRSISITPTYQSLLSPKLPKYPPPPPPPPPTKKLNRQCQKVGNCHLFFKAHWSPCTHSECTSPKQAS